MWCTSSKSWIGTWDRQAISGVSNRCLFSCCWKNGTAALPNSHQAHLLKCVNNRATFLNPCPFVTRYSRRKRFVSVIWRKNRNSASLLPPVYESARRVNNCGTRLQRYTGRCRRYSFFATKRSPSHICCGSNLPALWKQTACLATANF